VCVKGVYETLLTHCCWWWWSELGTVTMLSMTTLTRWCQQLSVLRCCCCVSSPVSYCAPATHVVSGSPKPPRRTPSPTNWPCCYVAVHKLCRQVFHNCISGAASYIYNFSKYFHWYTQQYGEWVLKIPSHRKHLVNSTAVVNISQGNVATH